MPAPAKQSHAPTRNPRPGSARSTRVLAGLALAAASLTGLGGSLLRDAGPATGSALSAENLEKRIDPNAANEAELKLLPRVGPVLAGRIVTNRDEYGPFRDANDLQRVSGIGPKTVERIAPMLQFASDRLESASDGPGVGTYLGGDR